MAEKSTSPDSTDLVKETKEQPKGHAAKIAVGIGIAICFCIWMFQNSETVLLKVRVEANKSTWKWVAIPDGWSCNIVIDDVGKNYRPQAVFAVNSSSSPEIKFSNGDTLDLGDKTEKLFISVPDSNPKDEETLIITMKKVR
jgi:hypothetical protein